MLGVMIDCSRNAVMSVKAIKAYVDLLKKMGYDTLMLYTEDTYEVNNEPYFGFMRGRYTKAEIKEIDAYCRAHGVELIPCIQTLAHFNAIFHASDKYDAIRDCDDILLIEDDRTHQLLENIFDTLAECFTSRKVHIGMDEADKVGLGKYMKKHGFEDRFELINRHLHKVCEMAERRGLVPMLWSDMFYRFATNAGGYNDNVDLQAIREKAGLPETATLIYWDYYSDDYENYVKVIRGHQVFGNPVAFAGGAWTWKGFTPDNAFSMKTTEAALRACRETGVKDVLMTVWGDDGAECSRLAVLPSLLYAAEAYRGNTDMADIAAKFEKLTGMQMADFMLLDELNKLQGMHRYNPSKYLLYNDPLMGLNDCRVAAGDGAYYGALKEKILAVKAIEPYRPIFDMAAALCRVLETKAELGVRTRQAYLEKNSNALRTLAAETYPGVIADLEAFYRAFAAQWAAENKPHGFDIQDIRIGGLIWRLKQTAQRLLDFADGKADAIPELDEEILEGTGLIAWSRIVSPNVMSHIFFG